MENRNNWEQRESFSDIRKFIGKILRRWHWIAIILFWSLLIAFLYNRYQTPIYNINAAIITKKFDDTKASNDVSELFNESYFRTQIEVAQEIPLLKSQAKIKETLKRLNFNVTYLVEGNVKTTEVYPGSFFSAVIDTTSANIPYDIPITVNWNDGSTYSLSSENQALNKFFDGKICHYGAYCEFNGLRIRLDRRIGQFPVSGYHYYFIVNNPAYLLSAYSGKLQISWRQQGSAILNINVQSALPEKDLDFVNRYIQVVIEQGLEEKNQEATNTINFIDEQMKILSDTLLNFLVEIDSMKLVNRDLSYGSDYIFQKLNGLDSQKTNFLLADRYYNYLENYVRKKRYDLIFAPDMIGLNAPLLDDLVNQLIKFKMEDQLDLTSENKMNPLVIRENDKTKRLIQDIYENLRNLRESNRQSIMGIDNELNFYLSSVKQLQVQTRELTRLEKFFTYNETMFTLLLQKKTEARIAKASTTSDYEIVEPPAYSHMPVSPDKAKNFLIALLLGIGLPISLIYLSDMLSDRIVTKDDLRKVTNIPVLGHVGHSLLETNLVVKKNPKSVIAESFRTIRANLQYFTGAEDKGSKIIMVTSSISDEGKTFCSINLAHIIALFGKKTLLIGTDMRKPSLASYVGMRDQPGLSNYLAGFITLDQLIVEQGPENFDIILSGDIPPNPAELLATDKMVSLMLELRKKYDFILLDTPPIGLVSDALELLRNTDFNLLVVRQGKTVKNALAAVNELYQDGKIKDMGIIFNDVDFRKLDYSYGYRYGYNYRYGYYYRGGYGYGYFDEDKKERKRGIFSRFRSRSSGKNQD